MFGRNIKNKKILVIGHDIGGAKLIKIFCLVKGFKPNFFLKGPSKKNLKIRNYSNNLQNALLNHDIIFIGTSGKSNLEINAINYCKKHRKKHFVFLDHWINYKQRFLRKKKFTIPQNIIVFDKKSFSLVKKSFKNCNINIKWIKNIFEDFKKKIINKKSKIKQNKILYASPFYGDLYDKDFDIKLFRIFIKKKLFKNKKIFYKKHPSEPKKIFHYLKKEFPYIEEEKRNFIEDFYFEYKYVVSSNSMILVFSKLLKLITYNNIKKTGLDNILPKKYINKIV